MKLILISVRDFALPVPRTGSIETHSGYGRASADGQQIHAQIQALRADTCENYRSEVALSHDFVRGDYTFRVGGRVDGLFDTSPPKIEEIKSGFNYRDLKHKLIGAVSDHPYSWQLRTYGYIYRALNETIPKLSFHLVSSRTGTSEDLEIALDIEFYEAWLERRLDELVKEADESEKRAERRKRTAAKLEFPFERPRPGQTDLIRTIEEGIESNRRLLLQAPTGLGKTVGVLYPTLREALGRGHRVIYITPKNSQHAVAEDAVDRFRATGAKLKHLTMTAKGKICFKNEPLCNPDYCEYARDHYTKVDEYSLLEQLARKKKLDFRTFRDLGEKYEVCPFELQLDAAQQADVIICDYNYVFAPRAAIGRIDATSIGEEGKPNLVIDEAHNLPSRAMDYFSPALSTLTLERMRPAIQELPDRYRGKALELLDECIESIASCRPESVNKATLIEPPSEVFLAQEENLRAFQSRYLDSDIEIKPKDVVLRLCSYWSDFTAALEFVAEPRRPEFFTTFQPIEPKGGVIKITCCDASAMLKDTYDKYQQVVAFSATLKPFDYYSKLSGLEPEKLKIAEFVSPFSKEQRKLLIIPEISTKYSDRERNYRKIAEAIARIAAVRPGNYFAFFPSFEFLRQVLERFTLPDGFTALRQEKEMRAPDIERFISHLREGSQPTIVFAVQGGVFSEGIDYPDKMLIGAFVIGPPLPIFDLEREQMREYYQRCYGAGFDYAYTFPAMAKAVQAAGRVIRSESDTGLIVLMDGRFLAPGYTQSMPADWFAEDPRELVSRKILSDVSEFWKGTDSDESR